MANDIVSAALLRTHLNEARNAIETTDDDFELDELVNELREVYVNDVERKLMNNDMELELTLQQLQMFDNGVIELKKPKPNNRLDYLDDLYEDDELQNDIPTPVVEPVEMEQPVIEPPQFSFLKPTVVDDAAQQNSSRSTRSMSSTSNRSASANTVSLETEFMKLRLKAAQEGNPHLFAKVVKLERELSSIKMESPSPTLDQFVQEFGGEQKVQMPFSVMGQMDQMSQGSGYVKSLLDNIQKQLQETERLVAQHEQESASIVQEISMLKRYGNSPMNQMMGPQMMGAQMMGYGLSPTHNSSVNYTATPNNNGSRIPDIQQHMNQGSPGAPQGGDQEDEELRKLRLEHMKEIERIKLEQEKLMHERELEEFRTKIEQDKEKKQKLEEERKMKEQVEEQKRLARLRREKAREAGFVALNEGGSEMKQGFQIYFDYALGLPASLNSLSLVYAIYDTETLSLKVPIRRTGVCETDYISDTVIEQGLGNLKQGILLIRRQYPKELLNNHHPMKLVVELLNVTQPPDHKDPPRVDSIGWTTLHLTSDDLKLSTGLFRLPIFKPHVDAKLRANQIDQFYKRFPSAELFIRVVAPENYKPMDMFPVTPDTQSQYSLPECFKQKKTGTHTIATPIKSSRSFSSRKAGLAAAVRMNSQVKDILAAKISRAPSTVSFRLPPSSPAKRRDATSRTSNYSVADSNHV